MTRTSLHRCTRRAAPLVLGTLLLAGCGTTSAPPATVTSRRDPTVPPQPFPSIAVISHVAKADPAWAVALAPSLTNVFGHYGVRVLVQNRDPLAVQADRNAYADELAKFAPKAWLVLQPGDGTVDRDGRQTQRRFEAGLFRPGTGATDRVLAWRASIAVNPAAGALQPADMKQLALSLARKLRADGFLAPPPASVEATQKSGGHPVGGQLKQE